MLHTVQGKGLHLLLCEGSLWLHLHNVSQHFSHSCLSHLSVFGSATWSLPWSLTSKDNYVKLPFPTTIKCVKSNNQALVWTYTLGPSGQHGEGEGAGSPTSVPVGQQQRRGASALMLPCQHLSDVIRIGRHLTAIVPSRVLTRSTWAHR